MILSVSGTSFVRRLFAVSFLFLMFAEWGSHGIIYANSISSDSRSISASEGGDEDPCNTLIMCSDGHRRDRQMPSFSHDATPHNALFDRNAGFKNLGLGQKNAKLSVTNVNGIFRPPDPTFHPPNFS
jgi:hypothetical protein